MALWFRNQVAKSMQLPKKGLFGVYISRVFKKRNTFLERGAVRLCNIQPHHKVLEVGFGLGIGLEAAYEHIKDGSGKVFGVEPSEYMISLASRHLQRQIDEGKISLCLGTADNLPYNTDTFDAVFHVNCYYFWPSMREAMREIYRVMKPGAVMIATLNLKRMQHLKEKGMLKYGNLDPLKYMVSLEQYGFENVQFKYIDEGEDRFEAIFAEIREKPVFYDQEDMKTDGMDSKYSSVQEKMEDLEKMKKVS